MVNLGPFNQIAFEKHTDHPSKTLPDKKTKNCFLGEGSKKYSKKQFIPHFGDHSTDIQPKT